jgi:hypothetical protein
MQIFEAFAGQEPIFVDICVPFYGGPGRFTGEIGKGQGTSFDTIKRLIRIAPRRRNFGRDEEDSEMN